LGYGWHESNWGGTLPTKEDLDKYFPDFPVAFTKADAHCVWVNSKALSLMSLPKQLEVAGGVVVQDKNHKPTGLFIDAAKKWVEKLIPQLSQKQIQNYILRAQNIFHENGFTHVRDVGCEFQQWEILKKLEINNQLQLFVESFYYLKDDIPLNEFLDKIVSLKNQDSALIKSRGLKIFFDGALGSEGALLSGNYQGSGQCGFQIYSDEILKDIIAATWQRNLEVAVHCIGDLAVEKVVDISLDLQSEGVFGKIHLEHAQMAKPTDILKMKNLNVSCHMQPCHWLSDRPWLKDKLGELYAFVFPWQALKQAGIDFDFGSDSPIEKPSIFTNLVALYESPQAGINKLQGDLKPYFQYGRKDSVSGCKTYFENGKVKEVYFLNKKIYG